MTKFLRFLLLLALLALLWCAVLWFGLPDEWIQNLLQSGSLPSLIAAHAGPPLFVAIAWKTGQRLWHWRVKRTEKTASQKEARKKLTAHEEAKTAHQKELARQRAHVECRAVWATVLAMPDYYEDETAQCTLIPQNAGEIQTTGREAALIASLQQVFEKALLSCKASAFLSVMLLSNEAAHQDWAKRAWHQAITMLDLEHAPSQPCIALPGQGNIPDRVIDLFEENPNLPAVLLVGMDSPLAEAQQTDSPTDPTSRPGHAVVALLLSRPGLSAPEDVPITNPERDADPYTPFWERELNTKRVADTPGWGRVPPALRPAFLQRSPPIATLHRTSTISSPASKKFALKKQVHEALKEVFIHAGLHDVPFEGEKTEAAPETPALGWIVHNADPAGLGSVIFSLMDHGQELEPLVETSHIEEAHGNTGAARSALMLAEATMRAAQLKQPVLVAELSTDSGMGIGLVRPVL